MAMCKGQTFVTHQVFMILRALDITRVQNRRIHIFYKGGYMCPTVLVYGFGKLESKAA